MRKELYDSVWAKTRKQLSIDWRVPPQKITDLCKLHDIPLPAAGYWTLIALNKPTEVPFLEGNGDVVIELNPLTSSSPRSIKSKNDTTPKEPTNAVDLSEFSSIELTPSVDQALPAIRKAYRSYNSPSAARHYRYQYVWPQGNTLLRMAVMPPVVERALLLIDSVVRDCQRRKWKVLLPSSENRNMNAVVIDGVAVEFSISEVRLQEKVKSEDSWKEWDYIYHSTGPLRFQYGTRYSKRELKDGKRGNLESKLADIIQGFVDEVALVKQLEEQRKNREHQRQLDQKVEAMVRDVLAFNKKCDTQLTAQLSADELDPATTTTSTEWLTPVDVLEAVKETIANQDNHELKALDVDGGVEHVLRWRALSW